MRNPCLLLVPLILLMVPRAVGQMYSQSTSIGAPQTTLYSSAIDQVDLMSGNLTIKIPMLHLPGRGIDTDITLTSVSKVWNTAFQYDDVIGVWSDATYATNDGDPAILIGIPKMLASVQSSGPFCVHSLTTYVGDPGGPGPPGMMWTCPGGYVATQSLQYYDGTRQVLIGPAEGYNQPADPTKRPFYGAVPGSLWSTDNSYTVTGGVGVIHKDGSSSGPGVIRDRNGNTITSTASGYMDTVGRSIVTSVSTREGFPSSLQQISYTDSNGDSQSIQISYSYPDVAFPCSDGSYPCTNYFTNARYGDAGVQALPTTITLANGSMYSISYVMNPDGTSSGEVERVVLPAGGYIRYEYGFDGPNERYGELRYITKRAVSPTGKAADEQVWLYSIPREYSEVTDPSGNRHREYFDGGQGVNTTVGEVDPYLTFNSPGIMLEAQDFDVFGTLLQQVNNTETFDDSSYSFGNLNAWATVSHSNNRIETSSTTSYPGGIARVTAYQYASYGNVKEETDSDWGMGTSGPIIRTIDRTFLVDTNPAYSTPLVHVLDLPQSESVSGDCSWGPGTCSSKAYGYDQYGQGQLPIPLVGTMGVVSHDYVNYGTGTLLRGNRTTSVELGEASWPDRITEVAYNDLGEPVAVRQPGGVVETFSYVDNYASGVPSGLNTLAFVTEHDVTPSAGVGQRFRFQYYWGSGLPAANCGPNYPEAQSCQFQIAPSGRPDYTGTRYDAEMRMVLMNFGDGGFIGTTYPDTSHSFSRNGAGVQVEATLDGLGKTVQTQIVSDPLGPIYTDTSYDAVGRILSTSNPYRSSVERTFGTTTNTYDGLGRLSGIRHPDGSEILLSLYGNTITVQDEGGSRWARSYDALNRLIRVVELGSAAIPLNLETLYSYDAMSNLLSITQKGASSEMRRTRRFTYDSFSDLITSTNPETGTICYGVWSGPNCVNGYDHNGNLLVKTDARGVTTSYSYDALNRLLSKTYTSDTSGTASSCYQYDTSSIAGASGNLVGHLTNSWTQSGACPSSPALNVFSRRSILSYDPMGRLQSEQQCTRGTCGSTVTHPVGYGYDLAGNVVTHTNGIGTMTFTNCYDGANHLALVASASVPCSTPTSVPSASLFSAPSYSPAGGLTGALFGAGLQLTRTYDNRLRISSETDTGVVVPSPLPGSATFTITGLEQTKP